MPYSELGAWIPTVSFLYGGDARLCWVRYTQGHSYV